MTDLVNFIVRTIQSVLNRDALDRAIGHFEKSKAALDAASIAHLKKADKHIGKANDHYDAAAVSQRAGRDAYAAADAEADKAARAARISAKVAELVA